MPKYLLVLHAEQMKHADAACCNLGFPVLATEQKKQLGYVTTIKVGDNLLLPRSEQERLA
ncbi:MAG: hypothetical protein R3C12_18575 [Planctomycetaceae bacterium]